MAATGVHHSFVWSDESGLLQLRRQLRFMRTVRTEEARAIQHLLLNHFQIKINHRRDVEGDELADNQGHRLITTNPSARRLSPSPP